RRRADTGTDPDLYQFRRHAFELVDQDRDRHPAVRLHRVPAAHGGLREAIGAKDRKNCPRSCAAVNSQLVSIPTRRSHSNHAAVARTIGIDIISGRYGEGVKLPGDAELTLMFGVSR